MSARDVIADALQNTPEGQSEWGHIGRAEQILDAIQAMPDAERIALARALVPPGWVVVRWPPTGDDVQACADELNPFAETAWQYRLSVETACEVIDVWMRRAAILASGEETT